MVIAEIAEGEPEGVANLPVGFAELRHDALAHFHVGLILDGTNPEAEQVGAPLLANLDGIERVAKRFGHRAALLVEGPAVRYNAAIGRSISHAGSDENRTVEPAAVLIGAFEVDVGGPLGAFQD